MRRYVKLLGVILCGAATVDLYDVVATDEHLEFDGYDELPAWMTVEQIRRRYGVSGVRVEPGDRSAPN